jgi:hypothetical protein
MRIRSLMFLASCLLLFACRSVSAQSTFPNSLPRGCTDGQLAVYQLATNVWICGSGAGTGDVTASGTLTANTIILGNGTTSIKSTTTGTGIVTALGVNVGSAGAPILFNGAGGTPSSMTGTNITAIPLAGLVPGSDNGVAVSTGSAYVQKILPDCTDTGGNHLNYTDSTNAFSCGTSGGSGTAFIRAAYAAKTSAYPVVMATDGTIELTTNAATITLPTAVGVAGQAVILKNLQTANALTIATTSAQTIDGAAPGTITNGCLTLESDGANWRIAGSCGLPLSSLTSGGVIYASSTAAVASSALLAANAPVLGGGAGTAPATVAGITSDGTAKLILGVNTTTIGTVKMFGNTSGDFTLTPTAVAGTASVGTLPARSGVMAMETGSTFTTGTIQLRPIYLFTAGVCQNTTASIGLSLFTSNTPTATCKTGSNTTFGVAQYTATAQQVQGMILVPADLTSTSVLLKAAYMGETTSTGNVTWTFSYARVAAGSTLDPSWTDITVTDAAGTSNQLNIIEQTLTLTSLAANDVLFWKFTYTTAPTTPGNQDLIMLSLIPLRTFTIGG